MSKTPLIKPFESKRARAVAIPMQLYAFWYLFTNFFEDSNDAVSGFFLLFFGGAFIGWIINIWVKRRKRQQIEAKEWEEKSWQIDRERTARAALEAEGLDAVNARLAALEAERDHLRQIADEALRTNQSGGLDRQSALDILGLNDDFTDADLKRQRIEMVKRSHPDQGGSHGLAKIVNEAFELLKK